MTNYYLNLPTSGSYNWTTAAIWSTNTNGSSPAATPPGSGDNVYPSAAITSGATLVVDATANCNNFDMTANGGLSVTMTLSLGNQLLNIYGSLTMNSNFVDSPDYGTGDYLFAGTGTQNLTTAGVVIYHRLDMAGTGTLNFLDNITMGANGNNSIYLYSGTMNTNNKNITFQAYSGGFNITGNQTRILNLGSSTISFDALSNGWLTTPTTNLTFNAGTSTINYAYSSFDGGGLTYGTLNITGTVCTITGSNTFTTLSFQPSATQTITFTDGTTQTVTNFTGTNGTNVITMQGSGTAGWYLTKSGGGTVSMDYLALSYSNASPSTLTWYAGTHSTNTIGNSGWIFTAPPAAAIGCVLPLGFVHGH